MRRPITLVILKRWWVRALLAAGIGALAAWFEFFDPPKGDPKDYNAADGLLGFMNICFKLLLGVILFVVSLAYLTNRAGRLEKAHDRR